MSNYVLNEEKMFADVTDDIAIIINSETGIYYGLNALGTTIFENITNNVPTNAILSALKSIEDCPLDIEEKLNSFIQKLIDLEVLKEGEPCSKNAQIKEQTAKDDLFKMNVSEYNDAQELLLADPIHEVKEETGWTPQKDSIGYTKEETIEREMKMEAQEV